MFFYISSVLKIIFFEQINPKNVIIHSIIYFGKVPKLLYLRGLVMNKRTSKQKRENENKINRRCN
jgi:hypothetical protein